MEIYPMLTGSQLRQYLHISTRKLKYLMDHDYIPHEDTVPIGGLARSWNPGLLQLRPPARMEHLVQIGAHTDVRILGHQLQRTVAGSVKAPGADGLHRHLRAPLPQLLHRGIGGTGIQHHHLVCLAHGVHPPLHKGFLIFTDGIDHYFH